MSKIIICLTFLMLTFSVSAGVFPTVKVTPIVDVRIEMADNGNLYLNGSTTTLSQLQHFFEREPGSLDESVLIIAADSVISEDVLRVMGICCNYKYYSVRLIYQPVFIEKS